MSKLPAIQFYPGDWRKDLGVQSLTYHDRGVWWEMLLLMHEGERRGMLMLNGMAMPIESIAQLLGLDKQTATKTVGRLLTSGVASRDDETGAIYSRRMVKDEKLRQIRTESGRRGGNPSLVKQIPTTQDKQIPTPSSSSSISITKQVPPLPPEPALDLDSIHTRILSESVGIFDIRQQSDMHRLLGQFIRDSKSPPEAAIQAMTRRWDEYQAAMPTLSYSYGSSHKFFMSGNWNRPEVWPRAGNGTGPRAEAEARWAAHMAKDEDTDEAK